LAQGAIRGITVSAEFGWTFWLAVAVAGLCLAAKIYHKKLDRPAADEKVPPMEGLPNSVFSAR
jgi:hypothetical protein